MICEFTTIHEDLRDKKSLIIHSEMLSELLTNSGTTSPPQERIKNLPHKQATDVDATPKRQRAAKPNNWHPNLMAALKRPLQTAGSTTFTKTMKFCKNDAYSIFPKGSPLFTPNAFSEIVLQREVQLKEHHIHGWTGQTYFGPVRGIQERPDQN